MTITSLVINMLNDCYVVMYVEIHFLVNLLNSAARK